MNDDRIWNLEHSLWTGDADHYRELIDEASLFVVPAPPFVMAGSTAAAEMGKSPRWADVTFTDQQVVRPQEGLIVIAYRAAARADGRDNCTAHCTTTLRRLAHEEWRVVQHQQTPRLIATVSRQMEKI